MLTHATPETLRAGTSTTVEITLRNLGDQPISPGEGDRFAYHWLDRAGKVVERDGVRTDFVGSIAPGETVRVSATLRAPAQPGAYFLQWEPVREQVGWFGPPRRSRDVLIPVEVASAGSQWQLISAEMPSSLRASEEAEVALRLRNEGPEAWDPALGDRLSYHWYGADEEPVVRDGLRSELPGPVAVGEEVTVIARLRAPGSSGHYGLSWEPLREGVRWRGDPSQARGVEVLEPAIVWAPADVDGVHGALAAPQGLHAGERMRFELTLRNLGEEALDPALGDRLSYHWLRADDARTPVIWDGARTDLPVALTPGETMRVAAELRAPADAGRYRLVWAMVREGQGWFPAMGGPSAAETLVEVLPQRFSFEVESVSWPWWMPAVGEATVDVTVRNTGAATWSAEDRDRLSYHWYEADGVTLVEREGKRTRIARAVAPGEAITVPLVVSGPGRGGDFVLALDMVREHVAWFGEPGHDPEDDPGDDPALGESPARTDIFVIWPSGTRQVVFLLLSGLGLLIARRRRPQPDSRHWAWFGVMPAVWCFVATWLLIVTFAELSGIALWRDSVLFAPATAALPALIVVLAPIGWRGLVGLLWCVFLSTLAIADLVYLHFLGSIVPVHALTAAHQVGDIGSSVRAVLEPAYGWLLPLPIAALLIALLWPRGERGRRGTRRQRLGASGLAAALALAMASPFIGEMREIMASQLGKRVFSEQRNVGRLGLVGAHVFDVARALRERRGRGQATAGEVEAIGRFFAERAALRDDAIAEEQSVPVEARTHALAQGDNLLVIQIESLQGWVIGAEVDGQEITPFLNDLRRRGLYFPSIADVTAQGMTSDAEYATLNSAYPLAQGAISFLRADNDFATLAHALAEVGYSTFSAHPHKRGFWNRAVLHPRYGFARSLFARELGPGRKIAWGLADEPFFERALPEIAALPEPFFAFLVTLSVHHPYEYPLERRRLALGKLEDTPLGNYLHGMHEMDGAVRQLFATLTERGLADHTLVALYGDHDARLGAVPEVLEVAGVSSWSPAVPSLLERVPLFVVAPTDTEKEKTNLRGVSRRVGSLVDVAPTLLHLLGVPAPGGFIGAPLLPSGDRPGGLDGDGRIAVYADGSALSAEHLWVVGGRHVPASGACFTALGEPAELTACAEVAAVAREHLNASRAVVDLDLARTLKAR